jgi:hypothetical protein
MQPGMEWLASAMAVALLALPAIGEAAVPPDDAGDTDDAEADKAPGEAADKAPGEAAIGLDVDVEIASAFVFRGLNLFGDRQNDQRAAVFPSITVSAGPVSGGYWGAYQLSGGNALRKVYEGYGAENDLWVSYEGAAGELGYSASLTYYTFPFADEATAGAATPMYLEPGVGVSYEAAVDAGLNVFYFRGLQDATQGLSYIYINPSVTRTIRLTGSTELTLGGSSGYKVWTNDPEAGDNTFDVQLDAGLNILFGSAHVAPAVHVAWTNLADLGLGDMLVVWVGVQLGGSAPAR